MKRDNEIMPEVIFAPVHPELKRLVGEAAERDDVPMNEYVAKILATFFNRPDLAAVPRKRPGRRWKKPV